jgi:hypothetical protein
MDIYDNDLMKIAVVQELFGYTIDRYHRKQMLEAELSLIE